MCIRFQVSSPETSRYDDPHSGSAEESAECSHLPEMKQQQEGYTKHGTALANRNRTEPRPTDTTATCRIASPGETDAENQESDNENRLHGTRERNRANQASVINEFACRIALAHILPSARLFRFENQSYGRECC